MMLASSALGFAPMAPATTVSTAARAAAPAMETKADMVALAEKLNPIVGFWCVHRPAACAPLGWPAAGCGARAASLTAATPATAQGPDEPLRVRPVEPG